MTISSFSELLKYLKVKPLYKRDKKSCISNYRPILLSTAFSKIFEKVMNRRAKSQTQMTPLQMNSLLDLGRISHQIELYAGLQMKIFVLLLIMKYNWCYTM
jgi:hypothetical protein